MNLLTIENITKSYTGRELFKEASFFLQEGEKIGVIGINGTGKSTLLKIAAGLEEPDSGKVIKANHVLIRYLEQNPQFDENWTVLDSVMQYDGRAGFEKEKQTEDVLWNIESEVKSMLMKVGITDFTQKTSELSGGQRKRLALVAVLVKPCDILILDEPTNHLDYEMAEWLEKYLKNWRGALIMITHDRYFLDSVSNRIVEIDKGHIYSYQTNYSGYLQLKLQREDMEQASERKRQSVLRKEIEWMQRGARARSTKQKAHIQRYENLRDQKGIELTEKLEISSIKSRMGKTTIELHHISKAYGDKVLIKDFEYIFLKNDRIGFVGKNGTGKTTLMKIIMGLEAADSGEIVRGQTIKIGYYAQEIGEDEMDPTIRVIDYIKNVAEYVRTSDGLVSASAMLERFLFTPEQQYGLLGKLSGGERRRLHLLKVLMDAPNVLILDEPTNDLDIETMTILEDYLDAFDGIVITVSHDRYFLDRIVRRIFAFEEGSQIVQYEGGYTDFLAKSGAEDQNENAQIGAFEQSLGRKGTNQTGSVGKKGTDGADEAELETINEKKRPSWKGERKLKFSYKEEREYETIEEDIQKLEEAIEQAEQEMIAAARDFVKLGELTKQKEELEGQLEEKMERWEYLEDLAERIANQSRL